MSSRPVCTVLVLALAATSLAACQSSTGPEGMAFHGLVEKVGVATPAVEPKDFVKAARGPQGDYMPVGVTPSNGKIKVRDEAGVKNLRNELEATARQSEKAAQAAKQ